MLNFLKSSDLKNRIFFTISVLIIFRLLAHIPAPGVDLEGIRALLSGNAFLNLFNLFSGGGFQNFSIITLGLAPYINASIIMQLAGQIIPKLEELQKEGESGRALINQYTKYLTVPLALLQSYGIYFLLTTQIGIVDGLSSFELVVLIVTLTGGTLLLTWIGDLVTEKGIGNGVSLLIFAGIIGALPTSILNLYLSVNQDTIMNTIAFLILGLLVIVGIVLVNEGTRNIPLEYGRRDFSRPSSNSSYLPIKVNQVGVIPIIFAVSIVLIPSFLAPVLSSAPIYVLNVIGDFLTVNFTNASPLYYITEFTLVFVFTYFYTLVQFNPEKIAEDIKKRGGFIPGIRPGLGTQKYLFFIVTRLTLFGALFLGFVAILPYLVSEVFGVTYLVGVGGSGILIVVSVVLETIRQIESMLVTRNYERFLD